MYILIKGKTLVSDIQREGANVAVMIV